MDLIILNDGLYQLIPVTKQIMEGIVITAEIDCFDLCDILRIKLTGYADTLNLHIMNDGSGSFVGCICRQDFLGQKYFLLKIINQLIPFHDSRICILFLLQQNHF